MPSGSGHHQGEGLRPKLHLPRFQSLSHAQVQVQLQVLLLLAIGRPQRQAFPVRVPGEWGRVEVSFPSSNTWLWGGRRSAYPVRAKLAQYLIIFLLSNSSSFVAPSAGDDHRIRLLQTLAGCPRCLPWDERLSPLSSRWILTSLLSHATHLVFVGAEARSTRGCPRSRGLQVAEAEPTPSLLTPCSSGHSPEAARSLGDTDHLSLSRLLCFFV